MLIAEWNDYCQILKIDFQYLEIINEIASPLLNESMQNLRLFRSQAHILFT